MDVESVDPDGMRDGDVAEPDRLPIEQVEQAFVEIVRERQPVAAEDVEQVLAERFGLEDDPSIETLLDDVEEHLLDDGPLAMLAPDRFVHVPSLLDGVVLTHRLTEAEQEADVLEAGDLPGFGRTGLTWQGQRVAADQGESGRTRWLGPDGWLRSVSPGTVLAVTVSPDGEVSVTPLDAEPAADDGVVAAIRTAYDAGVEETWMPVSAEDLLLAAVADDPTAFSHPALPLRELAAAAGLEHRDERYAHEESVWREAELVARQHRAFDRLGRGRAARDAVSVLSLLEEVDTRDVATTREILSVLSDPDVLEFVPEELLGVDDDPDRLAEFTTLTDRLLAAASRPAHRAVAHWMAALACERSGVVLDAESHLREAVRDDPDWPCAQDRLAWYESDRGDAAAAVARWRRMGATHQSSQDLATMEPFAAAAAPPRLGRNERCWCGSGRKYKACHLGRPVQAPLPERVGWLCRKAAAYLERRGGGIAPRVIAAATARAQDPDDAASLLEALGDPLVLDTVLHEGGWFDRFLADRGPLLPDDEAMLARSWTLVERTVCEVLDVTPGVGVTLRDLRTGDRVDVRERTFSRETTLGAMVCTRVVPDGESHQLIGGLFRVEPGTEAGLLDLLDSGDGHELLHHVAELHRPPRLVTGDGDPLRDCRADLEVAEPEAARAELDRRYEPDGQGWVSYVAHDGRPAGRDDGEPRTVRAWLRLADGLLTVRTASEPRLDATLAELRAALPGLRVTHDERRAFEPGPGSSSGAAPVDVPQDALLEFVDREERRWCEEQVPALGGRTPREAASDPTRREEVVRLIASFPEIDPTSGAFGLRPARLAELLGLETGA